MKKTTNNIHDAHIIPDGELDGIIVRLLSARDTLELIHDAMENGNDERPHNAVYSVMFLVKQIANDLDALQGKSLAVNSDETFAALAALMESEKEKKVSA